MTTVNPKHASGRTIGHSLEQRSCSPMLSVLLGRVQTLLERINDMEERLRELNPPALEAAQPEVQRTQRITLGNLEINHDARQVLLDGEKVRLSATEYQLLHELARNAGKVVLYRDLMRRTRGEYAPDSRYLKVYAGRLRAKLNSSDTSDPCHIETVRGVGYRLVS